LSRRRGARPSCAALSRPRLRAGACSETVISDQRGQVRFALNALETNCRRRGPTRSALECRPARRPAAPSAAGLIDFVSSTSGPRGKAIRGGAGFCRELAAPDDRVQAKRHGRLRRGRVARQDGHATYRPAAGAAALTVPARRRRDPYQLNLFACT
jgi:hypothetical protein